jgi:hypothetical protein
MLINRNFNPNLNPGLVAEQTLMVAKVHVQVQYTSHWEPQLRPWLMAFETLSLSRRPFQAAMTA